MVPPAAMRRVYVAIFLVSLVSLTTEILLTRIFDVLLWHNLSFMVISCAVFGLALGALRDVLAPPATAAGLGQRYLTLALHDDKRKTKSELADGRIEVSIWDPMSQIAVLDQPPLWRRRAGRALPAA
jgi:hypothetical protein